MSACLEKASLQPLVNSLGLTDDSHVFYAKLKQNPQAKLRALKQE